MVYSGNIIKNHRNLHDGFELNVIYNSGRISTIKKTDKIQKCNGDLRIDRYHKGNFLCAVIIDCAEVESIIIRKEEKY